MAEKQKPPEPESSDAQETSEEQPNENEGLGLGKIFLRYTPSWLISTLLHLILCLVLAWYTLPARETEKLDALNVGEAISAETTEMTEVDVDAPTEVTADQMASTEVSNLLESASNESLGDISISDLSLGSTGGSEIGEITKGVGGDEGPKTAAKFFGTQAKANRLVFVVDNSNSMNNGRFETALVELAKAIKTLDPKQKFYIVFYSDTAYPLFYPRVVREMIPATPANVRKVGVWLSTVQMCLQTRGEDAMRIAMMMRPDVIYLLGDGRFTDKTTKILLDKPVKGVVIHTLGMQLAKNTAKEFAAIAEAHNGRYRDVGVTPEGRELLQKMGPRPKNNSRNGYWGIALGQKKKK